MENKVYKLYGKILNSHFNKTIYELWVPVVCVKQQYDTSMPEVCSAERALSICVAGLGNFGDRLRALCALLNTPQVCLLCCQSFIHWLMEITAL